ncbi:MULTISPECIES: DUF4097 family beta strand repeat-containing protein [Paenibacillus]|uniref:DUF4097 family beta strand repeat protein n=1 Tax=Paenibacillus campinasensis TaxID=66347 RepID=A0A268EMM5_9BACL|nr:MULTISPECIES: DUF4097 family beta strand repeat-containing protein [Paenibacillus]MUG66937.1 DUF4097 family beta strand repeat protein [Paenibacillus campinasensis]PAD74368.1 protein liaG [Paenibacillus campinasensis]PAK50869.1 protein liaG [Paenibacillus sp. 7541]
MKHKIRVGRYTAALLLISTGALLLIDEWGGTDAIFLLLKWWPLLLVLWGVEYLLRYMFSKRRGERKDFRFRPDIRGITLAVLVSASVFVVSQHDHFLYLWNRVSLNLTVAAVDYSEAADNRFEKPPLYLPVTEDTTKMVVDHVNGDISIHREDVDDVIVETEVWVDREEPGMAELINEQSTMEADAGNTLVIRSQGKPYGQSGKRQPRMNVTITVPEERRMDMEIRTMNGAVAMTDVQANEYVTVESGNGPIYLENIGGNVTGQTLNGAVTVRGVLGDVKLSTNRGDMTAVDIFGAVQLTTQVGHMIVKRTTDDIQVNTRNGNIVVSGVRADLNAESLNGGIVIRSSTVGGDWNVYSAVGELNLHIPLGADYKLDGVISYGEIRTTLPNLSIEQKTITGESGTGEHVIHIEGNSSLNVYRSFPDALEKPETGGQVPHPH